MHLTMAAKDLKFHSREQWPWGLFVWSTMSPWRKFSRLQRLCLCLQMVVGPHSLSLKPWKLTSCCHSLSLTKDHLLFLDHFYSLSKSEGTYKLLSLITGTYVRVWFHMHIWVMCSITDWCLWPPGSAVLWMSMNAIRNSCFNVSDSK